MKGYGLTESTASVVRTVGPEETSRPGTTGRLIGGYEGKIVELDTGEAMPPGKQGELWLRGPAIMKGDELGIFFAFRFFFFSVN